MAEYTRKELNMAKLFKIDVSALPTHKERYEVLKLFENSFDTYPAWFEPDPLHRTFEYFEAFWAYDTSPPLPQIPNTVQVTEV
ncbi:hypothetical protein D7X48_14770 [bacterium D16-50]|nr:hypothetical protein D7X48_14770 [bacterium D16-50]